MFTGKSEVCVILSLKNRYCGSSTQQALRWTRGSDQGQAGPVLSDASAMVP